MPASSLKHWLLLTLAALFLTAQLLPVLRVFPNGLVDDDGYFYAQVGYNLGRLSASTFDGVHQTSGYHLLWGMALGGISKIAGVFTASKDLHLAAFYFCGIWICGVVAIGAFRDPLARAAAFCVLLFGFSLAETVLLSAVLIAIVGRLLAASPPFGSRAGDLALVALVPLIRIDALPLALVLLCCLVNRDARAAARLMSAVVAGAFVHAVWMYALFGDVFSVSSMLKAGAIGHAPHGVATFVLDNVRANIAASKAQVVRFVTVWALAGLALWQIASTPDRESRRRQLWTVAAVMTFYLPHLFLSRMRSWYFTPAHAVLLYLVARNACDSHETVVRRLAVRGIYVGLIVAYVAGIAYVNTTYRDDQVHVTAFIRQLRDRIPEAARMFMVDGSGYPGFFSERTLINGDGLMNDAVYAARLVNGGLAGYLEEQHICFVITNRRDVGDAIVDTGGLVVRRSDADLLSSVDARVTAPYGFLQLFRLRRPGCEP